MLQPTAEGLDDCRLLLSEANDPRSANQFPVPVVLVAKKTCVLCYGCEMNRLPVLMSWDRVFDTMVPRSFEVVFLFRKQPIARRTLDCDDELLWSNDLSVGHPPSAFDGCGSNRF